MQKYLKLADYDILVNYYEGFREKATITIPTNENQVIPFWDIVNLFETNDISELKFYYDANEELPRSKRKSELDLKFDGSLKGYTKILTTVDSRDANLGTITLLKPNVNNMDLDEVKEVMNDQIDDKLQQSSILYITRVMTTMLTDEQAVNCVDLFEEWKADTKYIDGDRKRVGNILYKCKQDHTSQSIYPPNLIPAIWDIVGNEEQGNIDNPVIVPDEFSSMVYVKGKYYLDKGILYLMNRDGMQDGEEISLTYRPSELVGHYFKVIES